jgi:hypothetical protein
VKVRSAGLNHLDIWVRKGRGDSELAGPHILGSAALKNTRYFFFNSGIVVFVNKICHKRQ